ncbi:callose synthase 5-like, partial [Trifolium medium]|nr:callose synthase 5-like [Trifolium medium]
IRAAVSALWNTRGLNWPVSFEQQSHRAGDLDILDWLRAMFGFQACILYTEYYGRKKIYGLLQLLMYSVYLSTEGQREESKGAFDSASC